MRSFRNEDGKYFHISYYLVFCPRYRRKIFTIDKLEVRFKEMVHAVCDSHNISVTDISCGPDYCYISINVPPNISAAGAIAKIKVNKAKTGLSATPDGHLRISKDKNKIRYYHCTEDNGEIYRHVIISFPQNLFLKKK